jgi:predicted enzyme related to lactoylglutathione lyase
MAAHGHFHWNELLTKDVERAKRFYSDTIGWTYEGMPMPGGSYWIASMVSDRWA